MTAKIITNITMTAGGAVAGIGASASNWGEFAAGILVAFIGAFFR